ncbi:hypothetical protein [Streptomyces sp. 142MFCol3.1]|uniref:hypothetical protein n=1 Tax=Streptomyces sp. 142MFCol3.1 TaxID=1172179 RepID=UPI0003FCC6AB|nr:hypothetical protein [Streptomyces sp. 142MFCol3.1]
MNWRWNVTSYDSIVLMKNLPSATLCGRTDRPQLFTEIVNSGSGTLLKNDAFGRSARASGP